MTNFIICFYNCNFEIKSKSVMFLIVCFYKNLQFVNYTI